MINGSATWQRVSLTSRLARSCVLALTIATVQTAGAETTAVPSRHYAVPLNKSIVIGLDRPVTKITKGQPDIANVVLLQPGQVLLQGRELGTTNVVLWSGDANIALVLDVEVTHDLESLKAKLYELLPDERIEVRSSRGSIVLSGQVSSLESMKAAVELATSYVPSMKKKSGTKTQPVINLMEVGGAQQVMLEVKVAEIARSLLRRMDFQFNAVNPTGQWTVGALNGGATFPNFVDPDGLTPLFGSGNPLGPPATVFQPDTPSISAGGLFAGLVSQDWIFNAALDAGKDNGLVKILAEPNLTTLTGQEASFLSGGEFPIPVPQGGTNNSITIEFKEFGVGVKFLPVVLDSGRINMKMNISVSEISSAAPVIVGGGGTESRFFVPSLTSRKAVSSLELSDGQTMGIAGLISDSLRENVDKFPWLGDIPGLGALFRSQNFQKNQSELVIFVTPRLARPIPRDQVRLPTDGFIEPDDVEFYLMGRLESRTAPAPVPAPTTAGVSEPPQPPAAASAALPVGFEGSGLEGKFGHQLSEE